VLLVEAFGKLLRDANRDTTRDANAESRALEDEEDLYSVFRARAELMGWASTDANRRPLLWEMNEAELTDGAGSDRIGVVQVGLGVGEFEADADFDANNTAPPADARGFRYGSLGASRPDNDPALALPALTQCFYDSLCRFGVVELSGLQATANFLKPRTQPNNHHAGTGNWFNVAPERRAEAIIAFDQGFLGGRTEAELASALRRRDTGYFVFRPAAAVSEQHSIKTDSPEFTGAHRSFSPALSGLGVPVTMPEWSASAAGLALSMVIGAARANAPGAGDYVVRIARIG